MRTSCACRHTHTATDTELQCVHGALPRVTAAAHTACDAGTLSRLHHFHSDILLTTLHKKDTLLTTPLHTLRLATYDLCCIHLPRLGCQMLANSSSGAHERRVCVCTLFRSLTEHGIEVCHSLGLEHPSIAIALGAAGAFRFLLTRNTQILRKQLENVAVLGQPLHKGLPQPFQLRVWLQNGVPVCQHIVVKPCPETHAGL